MRQEENLPAPPGVNVVYYWVKKTGEVISWSYAVLMAVIILQVVLRKGFSNGLIILEELQWHLYAIGFMFGMAYSQVLNSHVRVDLFYSHFSTKTQHIIEIIGLLILVIPFVSIIFIHSLDFVADSWRINERSAAPAGLPYRWLIKSIIPIAFVLLAITVIARIYHEVYMLVTRWRC
ncbi:TRAP transporter small permease subunit [Endozoicomonas sp. SM1973]|uniref:TRAP transporter small permease protein n=1 Tax=Spartinivicinus marinus TaxID=2994442 RepID=A0A853I591_9GAMM|nr:TRAP transporter small permease subunit [Spartinivicinus marinus]MCX4026903.1 TRAP transporter small permease subunit [Spartinivicinus marinus]NYZ66752.1 TRAP transporter small permease subunit [Spartinivicinus marinus]